jgi:hypothetical protein
MKNYQILVRGKNNLGQLGIRDKFYLNEYTTLPLFDGVPVSKISLNLGQTFVATKNSQIIRSNLSSWV